MKANARTWAPIGLLNRGGVKTASQLDELVIIQRLEDRTVHSGEVKRRLGLHARSESDPDPFGKLESRGKSTPSHFAAHWKPGGERFHIISDVVDTNWYGS